MNQYLVVGIVFLVVIAILATNKKLVETLKNIYKIEEQADGVDDTLAEDRKSVV